MGARLFTAVLPPSNVIEDLERFCEPRRDADDRLHWTRPQSWHLTMSFMASVRESSVEPLMENLGEVGARTHPFSVRLGGAGAFGRPESARVLWVGVDVGAANLQILSDRSRTAGERAGIRVDGGRFVPHLTLARMRRPIEATRWLRVLDAFQSEPWVSHELVLMQSHLRDRGFRYEVIGRFPFTTPRDGSISTFVGP